MKYPPTNPEAPETNWLVNWPPSVVWSNNIGRGCGSVAVYDGRLYAVGANGNGSDDIVYCFNARTGDLIWSNMYTLSTTNPYGPQSTPTVTSNEVYVMSHDNQLHCYNRFDGQLQWATSFFTPLPGYNASGSPLVVDDLVIVNAGKYGTAVRRAVPHDIVWGDVDDGTACGYASPVPCTVGSVDCVAILDAHSTVNIVPVATPSATPVITHDLREDIGDVYGDPIVYGDQLFFCGSSGAAMYTVGADTLALDWAGSYYETLMGQYMNCVIVGGYIYGVRLAYFSPAWVPCITCVSADTKATQWVRKFGDEGLPQRGYPSIQMMAADNKIVMLNIDGQVNVIDASPAGYVDAGDWIAPFASVDSEGEFTTPVVADGLLYCRSMAGVLVCYQIGNANARADNDGDGLPDTWERRYFRSRNDCAPGTDSDGDGQSNGDEFATGTQPTNAASALEATIVIAGQEVVVACDAKAADTIECAGKARYYTFESRANLLNGPWEGVPGFVDVVGDDTTIVYTNTSAAPAQFYRVKAALR